MVGRDELLSVLPPFTNRSILIEPVQDVPDIIREVVTAHRVFATDYDRIYRYFDCGTLLKTCEKLFEFCRKNIEYRVEGEAEQTTRSPSAIIAMGYGDCKHYAGFIAGVLDAIRRNTGKVAKWVYRFGGYEYNVREPGHVFVVVQDRVGEIWIDPVLGRFNDKSTKPVYATDKKINMPLYRVSGISQDAGENNEFFTAIDKYYPGLSLTGGGGGGAAIGWTWETSAGWTTTGPVIMPKIGHPYFGENFLGLSRYGNLNGTSIPELTRQMQSVIDETGPVDYNLDTGLVDKVLRANMQHWNFFYPNGTAPQPRAWRTDPELRSFLLLTITPDGRLTFDRDAEPPHNSPLIHRLTDWANYLIQAYSDQPYLVTLEHLKRLGSGWKTPDQGSLWHVIHAGDVNFARISDFILSIPGLEELAASFGLNMESLTNMASTYLTGGQATVAVEGATLDPEYSGGAGGRDNSIIIGVVVGGIVYWLGKSLLYGLGAGAAAWYFTKPKETEVYQLGPEDKAIKTQPTVTEQSQSQMADVMKTFFGGGGFPSGSSGTSSAGEGVYI